MKDHQSLGCPIIKDRLYFSTISHAHKPPSCTTALHFFSTDEEFTYIRFFEDFGPLNLAMVYRYCNLLKQKLECKTLCKKMIIHYTRSGTRDAQIKRVNAAFLMGAFAMLHLERSPQEAFELLTTPEPYIAFRDASYGPCMFHLTLFDCLKGLHKAILYKFYSPATFDVNEYEYFEKVENGDFNWIVPNKFLAFCGPTTKNSSECGGLQHSPEDYMPYFRAHNVSTVIRLNKAAYKSVRFTECGIEHYDLYFVDGGNPTDAILHRFLQICETQHGAIAVHCKAGLGRTGTLIGCYIMKHYRMTAGETIAWLRIARPGSVIGPQQQYMIQKQASLWAEGDRLRQAVTDTCRDTDSDSCRGTDMGTCRDADMGTIAIEAPEVQGEEREQSAVNQVLSRVETLNIGLAEGQQRQRENHPDSVADQENVDTSLEQEAEEEIEDELNQTQGDFLLEIKHKRAAKASSSKPRTTRTTRQTGYTGVLQPSTSCRAAGANVKVKSRAHALLMSCATGSTAVDNECDRSQSTRITRSMTKL